MRAKQYSRSGQGSSGGKFEKCDPFIASGDYGEQPSYAVPTTQPLIIFFNSVHYRNRHISLLLRLQFETLPEMLCGLQYIISATTRLHLGCRAAFGFPIVRISHERACAPSACSPSRARSSALILSVSAFLSVRPSVHIECRRQRPLR